jgi:hypothetical protein
MMGSLRDQMPRTTCVPEGDSYPNQAHAEAVTVLVMLVVDVLAEAEPQDKAELYAELGAAPPTPRTAESPSRRSRVGYQVRVGGGT